MWTFDWDTIIEAVTGSSKCFFAYIRGSWQSSEQRLTGRKGLALRLRAHRFQEEVHRAEVAQDRRARYPSSPKTTLPESDSEQTKCAWNPPRPVIEGEDTINSFCDPPLVTPAQKIGFRHPVYYERKNPTQDAPTSTPSTSKALSRRNSSSVAFMLPPKSGEDPTDSPLSSRQASARSTPPPTWVSALEVELQRRQSAATLASSNTTDSYESAQVRLQRKFRTESSTTICSDGCVIQRGFDTTPAASRITSTASSLNGKQFADTQRRIEVMRIARRIVFNERSTSRFEYGALNSGITTGIGGQLHRSGSAPLRRNTKTLDLQRSARTAQLSEQHRRAESEILPAVTKHDTPQSQTLAMRDGCPRVKSNVTIVPPEEAESAIATDDEDDDQDEQETREQAPKGRFLQFRPSKRLSPPAKGILKKHRLSSARSQASAQVTEPAQSPAPRQALRFAAQQKHASAVVPRRAPVRPGRRGGGRRGSGLRVGG
ncbi:hypothetical protein KC340_g14679 [Hortaea werneckii]|nr:hypothetical protein KC342_g15063 [Hortaea werneckii]KAI7064878.1 hypothetical protein KC339_g15916 [Hortaea werneckii]KAI7218520.1 hypothetical protein KC365_g12610 [Hortaea werneckii]KAI7297857.1 hypothetical protein KC340_g14679 [Hortaea werneckii]KAI7385806.1 hypothetical protein KC328_g10153 [Hortaea werneckii]